MADITTLREAVERLVRDGDTVALEGFTHLIPFAAAHEIIRQRITGLTLVRMTPDLVYDQLIGAGAARRLVFSWGGNPGVGSLHRLRDAVENGWPGPLELDEHSHAGMANRYVAGAARLPFAVLRGYRGSDPAERTGTVATVVCPFTGEELAAVAALNPDVTVVHAQRADRAGTVQLWGLLGVQKEAVLAADRVLVTVEEVVDGAGPGTRRGRAARRGHAARLGGRRRRPGARRRAPVVRRRVLGARQRLLPGLGPDRPGPRGVHRVARRARPRRR